MISYDLSFKGRRADADRITIGLEHILICNYLTTVNSEQAKMGKKKKRSAMVISFTILKLVCNLDGIVILMKNFEGESQSGWKTR